MPQLFDPLIILKPEKVLIEDTARVDSFCKIEGGQGVYIGHHVHIASFCHLNIGGGELIMNEGSSAGSGVRIVTGSALPDGVSCSAVAPAEQQHVIHGRCIIGKNATLYTGAIIAKPNITVGEGAVVAAGAVVTKDVPPFELWAGNPARKLRDLKEAVNG